MRRLLSLLFTSLAMLTLSIPPAYALETTWKSTTQNKPIQLLEDITHSFQMSAVVGGGLITIEGYTSPQAKVTLTSSQNNLGTKTTQANSEGFFRFENIVLPYDPGELWLQATDTQGLTSTPVALAEPPQSVEKITDIILPPSLAQSHGRFTKNVNGYAFGVTVPRSTVTVYFFSPQTENNLLNQLKNFIVSSWGTPKTALAQQETSLPIPQNQKTLKANSKGYFNFPLPKENFGNHRYFAAAIIQQNYSPKSNSLSFQVQTIWQNIYQQFALFAAKAFFAFWRLFSDLLSWITVEVITLFFLIRHRKKRQDSPPSS